VGRQKICTWGGGILNSKTTSPNNPISNLREGLAHIGKKLPEKCILKSGTFRISEGGREESGWARRC